MIIHDDQVAHQNLVAEARTLGIPTSLDDPRSPRTVDALRAAVTAAKDREGDAIPRYDDRPWN